jgi:hypothetical protein
MRVDRTDRFASMVDHIAKCSQRRDWGKAARRRCWRRAKSQGRADASFVAPWQGQRRGRASALAAPAHRWMRLHSDAGRPPRDIEGRRFRAGFILGNGLAGPDAVNRCSSHPVVPIADRDPVTRHRDMHTNRLMVISCRLCSNQMQVQLNAASLKQCSCELPVDCLHNILTVIRH